MNFDGGIDYDVAWHFKLAPNCHESSRTKLKHALFGECACVYMDTGPIVEAVLTNVVQRIYTCEFFSTFESMMLMLFWIVCCLLQFRVASTTVT